MSSRQRNRLANSRKLVELKEIESSSSSDNEEKPISMTTTSKFSQLESESDEEDDEEESEKEESVVVPIVEAPKASKKTKPSKQPKITQELDFDMLVTSSSNNTNTNSFTQYIHTIFHITDVIDLNCDTVMKRRFGNIMDINANNTQNMEGASKKQLKQYKLAQKRGLLLNADGSRMNQSKSSAIYKNKYVFGIPPQPFIRPGSNITGGYSMLPCHTPYVIGDMYAWEKEYYEHTQWYSIEYSVDYSRCNQIYTDIQQSGDANQLILFISQYPYHLEALIQLSVVFARTGHMDRASEMIRRCISNLEACFHHSFEPWKLSDKCYARVNCDCAENQVLFSAMMKHIQVTIMLGYPIVALNLTLVLLSLDPLRDPYCLLLLLDYLLVTTQQTQLFQAYYCGQKHGEQEYQYVLGYPYVFHQMDRNKDSTPVCALTICALPNWSYSHALLLYRQASGSTGSSVLMEKASCALMEAILSYPFVLFPLLTKAGVKTTESSGSTDWNKVFAHPLFASMHKYLPSKKHVYYHIADIYAVRNAALWQPEPVVTWVYNTVYALINPPKYASDYVSLYQPYQHQLKDVEIIINSLQEKYMKMSGRKELSKYQSADADNYCEEFPRLPPDVNPLDPQLIDGRFQMFHPRAAPRPARPRRNQREEAVAPMLPVSMMEVFDLMGVQYESVSIPNIILQVQFIIEEQSYLQYELTLDQMQEIVHRLQEVDRQAVQRPVQEGNMDVNAPLMQLFLQSLLPWSVLGGTVDEVEEERTEDEQDSDDGEEEYYYASDDDA